jgi:hypothetical protein
MTEELEVGDVLIHASSVFIVVFIQLYPESPDFRTASMLTSRMTLSSSWTTETSKWTHWTLVRKGGELRRARH